MENLVLPSSCVTPAGTSIEVQNELEENTHTHTHSMPIDAYIYESRCLVTYSKVKRVNRGFVTYYTIKLTLEIRTIVI